MRSLMVKISFVTLNCEGAPTRFLRAQIQPILASARAARWRPRSPDVEPYWLDNPGA